MWWLSIGPALFAMQRVPDSSHINGGRFMRTRKWARAAVLTGAAVAGAASVLLSAVTPAQASGPGGKHFRGSVFVNDNQYGSTHIQLISGNEFDIAVNSDFGIGICTRIYPNSGGVISYCDSNPSDGKATHYRFYYNWYQADIVDQYGHVGSVYSTPS
ncbi:hypothetical protein [Actinoplanes sp. N902-109]|uniref:hypothetical protein n=1 Tax=Actinoplanes sp. (strain N902-109) TaxID=649831 RepID=UPI0003293D9B|nr:hypothetical protein [Actinoplanes sp. N902-109]AGL16162.1 hypothetical protein L083_2652 [Actinoplanes sp. N902-109]